MAEPDRGGDERSEPIRRMVFMTYDAEGESVTLTL